MGTFKTSLYDSAVSSGSDFLDRAFNFIENVQSSRILKIAGFAVGAVAGLFALGGLFRVLAWTTAGWNQFSTTLHKK